MITEPEQSVDTTIGLDPVLARIAGAERAASRPVGSVRLVAISKTFEPSSIRPVLAEGHRNFGENRVQESLAKWPALLADYSDTVLHMVGPLQTNKAREAVDLFHVIHTVDRDRIAVALAKEMRRQARSPTLFVQVNTGEEAQKAGVKPQETAAFVRRCTDEHGLSIAGLMCIPPVREPPATHFALLADLAGQLGLARLSMGMSSDFETAIAFGATDVRVGSAVFGQRVAGVAPD